MTNLTEAIDCMLNGQKIKGKYGAWYIDGEQGCMDLIHELFDYVPLDDTSSESDDGMSAYWFSVTEDEKRITFRNDHRRASKGCGTPTLKEIEAAFQIAGKERNKKVRVRFVDTDGQPDTQQWLEKNEYDYDIKSRAYVKNLC